MDILGTVLGVIIVIVLIAAVLMPNHELPSEIKTEYRNYIVTNHGKLKTMTLALNDSTNEIIHVSQLILQTWAVGDTIR